MCFISLLVSISPEPVIDESDVLIFLPMILSIVSIIRLKFNSLLSMFFNYFSYEFAIEFIILNDEKEPNKPSGLGIIDHLDSNILDS